MRVKALEEFARGLIRDAWAGCEGGDEIQEHAQKLGLIVEEPGGYDPEKHGNSCVAEPGDQWFVFAEWLDDAIEPAGAREGVPLCDCERGHNGLGMAGRECDCTPTPAGAGDLVEGLRAHIAALGVACCTCGAKTFQAEFHDANCKVRNVAEALDNVDDIASRIEALEAEVAREKQRADAEAAEVNLLTHQRDAFRRDRNLAEHRATSAEAGRDALKAEVERKDKALREAGEAIAEYFRYLHGGETRGSYDGKPEREGLRKAGYAVSRALAPAKAGG